MFKGRSEEFKYNTIGKSMVILMVVIFVIYIGLGVIEAVLSVKEIIKAVSKFLNRRSKN